MPREITALLGGNQKLTLESSINGLWQVCGHYQYTRVVLQLPQKDAHDRIPLKVGDFSFGQKNIGFI
jgi:hypothetical protein